MAIYNNLLLFVAISCFFLHVDGDFVVVPKDTEAVVGGRVILFCQSTLPSVEWHHFPVGQSTNELVYQDGFIFNGYKGRFHVNKTQRGEYHLEIEDIRITDAGRFICMEKSDDAAQKSAELIVFEQYPSNKFCISRKTCSTTCDILELNCGMKSHGNIVPFMEWRDSANGRAVPGNSSILNGITTSSVQLRIGQTNAPAYVCEVKYPAEVSLKSQFSWSYAEPAIVAVPDKEEQIQTHNSAILIAAVVVMTLITCAMFVGFLIYYFRQKRQPNISVSVPEFTGRVEHNQSEDAESGQTAESRILLADEGGSRTGLVPRTSLNRGNAIHGLGVLDDEAFLVTRDGCVIEVFDLHTAEYKRSWKVEGLINPNDLATCPIKKYIFICDWKKAAEDKEIFCVDKNGKLKSRWISENEKGRISVTKDGNVIIAESWYNSIREYSWSGRLIKKFDTGRQKLHLWHAVKLVNGNFVASFGDTHDIIQEICIINTKGETVHSITKDSLSPSGVSLSVPRSLVVDKEGNIYVCDLYNARIIELTSELKFNRLLDVDKDGERLRGPLRVCIYESGSDLQLLVADSLKENGKWKDGKILVLNLGPNE